MAKFRAAEKIAPEESSRQTLLRHMTRHETFVMREIDGHGDSFTGSCAKTPSLAAQSRIAIRFRNTRLSLRWRDLRSWVATALGLERCSKERLMKISSIT
ncbi:hypothetical protein J8I87_37460 [Paraburkholderia sp. LEh10]|uniref:hypothetical protein n=1 Tax=Paraburkholderia sp. LEh10 TaxID=2821353 RepID=UPI001AE305DA|nr:hypothetical protein [Paraburkholderia sp. LEh10]MBP0595250.1 hypothetical protein [Paraburkholderia sp. LEh10]